MFGCDSILTVHLTVTNLNTNVTLSNTTLTAEQGSASCPWEDCVDGFVVIAGETDQSFTPVVTGNYAVILNDGVCTDISDCVNVMITGIEDGNIKTSIRIYPNPASDAWYIDLEETRRRVRVEVLDSGGKLLAVWTFRDMKIIPIRSELPSGLYFIHVVSDELNAVERLIRL